MRHGTERPRQRHTPSANLIALGRMGGGDMRPSIIAIMATAILVLATPALGASENDRDNCYQTADHDLKIDGCTRLLDDRDEPRSNHAIAYNNRGLAWQSKRDLDRAIADFDQAIRLDPPLAAPYNNRGGVWYAQRDFDRAIPDFDQAIRLDPTFAKAYFNRGLARYAKRDLDRAIADFDQAIRLNSELADAYNNRG